MRPYSSQMICQHRSLEPVATRNLGVPSLPSLIDRQLGQDSGAKLQCESVPLFAQIRTQKSPLDGGPYSEILAPFRISLSEI
ncbi:hypothetical protein OKW46_001859 [Paraburkholderia sp. WSM4179]|nr:hypothetical protein [Paraburkholderia sp. WSM4179]